MIPPGALVLLDSGVVVELARGSGVGQHIEHEHTLGARHERPLISIITIGEVLCLAGLWGWGAAKAAALRDLFAQLVVVDLSQGDIPERYAIIAGHSKRQGLGVGENDCWIAATAAATNAWLLTTDKDFDRLPAGLVHTMWIDPKAGA